MQFWVNERGQMLTVTDVTKVKGSELYGKRVKHSRYVVGCCMQPQSLNMWLSFDTMSGVRHWMKIFGFIQHEGENA